jgi:uncharacterized damage-inducible protein DinB
MATREALLAEYDHEVAATRRMLACVPGDRLAWKPHVQSRSIGALVAHLAEIPGWALHILEVPVFDLDRAPAIAEETSVAADFLRRFDEVTARTRRALDRSDAELNATWSLHRGGQELFSMPRCAAFRTLVLGHVVHHRGQLSVYLRLNDIPVPPTYGPTGDTHTSNDTSFKSQVRGQPQVTATTSDDLSSGDL